MVGAIRLAKRIDRQIEGIGEYGRRRWGDGGLSGLSVVLMSEGDPELGWYQQGGPCTEGRTASTALHLDRLGRREHPAPVPQQLLRWHAPAALPRQRPEHGGTDYSDVSTGWACHNFIGPHSECTESRFHCVSGAAWAPCKRYTCCHCSSGWQGGAAPARGRARPSGNCPTLGDPPYLGS